MNQTWYNLTIPNEGIWNVTVVAFDNMSEKLSSSIIVIIDLTPPTLTLTSPRNIYVNTTIVHIAWDCSDNAGIDHFEVFIDDCERYDVGMNECFIAYLSEGMHTIYVRAIDKAGNVAVHRTEVIVDITCPSVSIVFPQNNSYSNGTFAWNCIDNFGIDHFEIRIDNNSWIDVGLNTIYTANLTEATHMFYIKAIDKAGNIAIYCVVVTIDTTVPEIHLIQPLNMSVYETNIIEFSWYALDPSGISCYIIYYRNQSIQTQDTHYTIIAQEGENTVKIKVIDIAGNQRIITVIIYVDTSEPQIKIIYPYNESYLNNSVLEIEWICLEQNLDHFEIRINFWTWINIGNGTSYTITLEDGYYVIEIKAIDLFGRVGISRVSIFVDTTPPTIEIINPKNNSVVEMEKITVIFNASDNIALDSIFVLYDDSGWKSVTEHEIEIPLQIDTNKIYIKAVDKAGNSNVILLVITRRQKQPHGDIFMFGKWLIPPLLVGIFLLIVRLRKKKRIKKGDKETTDERGE